MSEALAEQSSRVLLDEKPYPNTEDTEDELEKLPHGDVLTIDESFSITAKAPSNLIIIAGPTGSGKTTLVTAIYQIFLHKILDKYTFAGSQTLLAFEQRSYLLKFKSGQTEPDMQKTRRGVDQLLHLNIQNAEHYKCNLLLSDFSGEDYSSVIANAEYAQNDFGIVKSAKCFLVLIDGDRISKKNERNSTLKNAIELLRTFIDAGLLNNCRAIIVAISKYDLFLKRCKDTPDLKDFEGLISERFLELSKEYQINIQIKKIASITYDSSFFDGESSLIDILDLWIRSTIDESAHYQANLGNFESHFNLLKFEGIVS